jgi:hypothetical protein
MARPKGSVNAVEPVVEITKVREIKHVARTIGLTNTGVAESAVEVEQYLRMTYFEAGWTLFDVSVLAHNPNTVTLMYILTR